MFKILKCLLSFLFLFSWSPPIFYSLLLSVVWIFIVFLVSGQEYRSYSIWMIHSTDFRFAPVAFLWTGSSISILPFQNKTSGEHFPSLLPIHWLSVHTTFICMHWYPLQVVLYFVLPLWPLLFIFMRKGKSSTHLKMPCGQQLVLLWPSALKISIKFSNPSPAWSWRGSHKSHTRFLTWLTSEKQAKRKQQQRISVILPWKLHGQSSVFSCQPPKVDQRWKPKTCKVILYYFYY